MTSEVHLSQEQSNAKSPFWWNSICSFLLATSSREKRMRAWSDQTQRNLRNHVKAFQSTGRAIKEASGNRGKKRKLDSAQEQAVKDKVALCISGNLKTNHRKLIKFFKEEMGIEISMSTVKRVEKRSSRGTNKSMSNYIAYDLTIIFLYSFPLTSLIARLVIRNDATWLRRLLWVSSYPIRCKCLNASSGLFPLARLFKYSLVNSVCQRFLSIRDTIQIRGREGRGKLSSHLVVLLCTYLLVHYYFSKTETWTLQNRDKVTIWTCWAKSPDRYFRSSTIEDLWKSATYISTNWVLWNQNCDFLLLHFPSSNYLRCASKLADQ